MWNNKESELKQIYCDILSGVSQFEYLGASVFVKHLSIFDSILIDNYNNKNLEAARRSGLKTEEAKLKELKTAGDWGADDENWIETNRFALTNLYKTRKTNIITSDAARLNEDIARAETELYEKLNKRKELIGVTADTWAASKTDEFSARLSLFKDLELTIPYLTEDDDIDTELFNSYSEALINTNQIRRLAISPFFRDVFYNYSSLYEFYGTKAASLTNNQIELYKWGKNFRIVFDNLTAKKPMPPEIADDPDGIVEWWNNKDRADSPATQYNTVTEPIKQEDIKNILGDKKTVRGEDAMKLVGKLFS